MKMILYLSGVEIVTSHGHGHFGGFFAKLFGHGKQKRNKPEGHGSQSKRAGWGGKHTPFSFGECIADGKSTMFCDKNMKLGLYLSHTTHLPYGSSSSRKWWFFFEKITFLTFLEILDSIMEKITVKLANIFLSEMTTF